MLSALFHSPQGRWNLCQSAILIRPFSDRNDSQRRCRSSNRKHLSNPRNELPIYLKSHLAGGCGNRLHQLYHDEQKTLIKTSRPRTARRPTVDGNDDLLGFAIAPARKDVQCGQVTRHEALSEVFILFDDAAVSPGPLAPFGVFNSM
jgi:hypothetical protein